MLSMTRVFISNMMANSHFLILAYLAKMEDFNCHGCLKLFDHVITVKHNVLDLQQVQIFCNKVVIQKLILNYLKEATTKSR